MLSIWKSLKFCRLLKGLRIVQAKNRLVASKQRKNQCTEKNPVNCLNLVIMLLFHSEQKRKDIFITWKKLFLGKKESENYLNVRTCVKRSKFKHFHCDRIFFVAVEKTGIHLNRAL